MVYQPQRLLPMRNKAFFKTNEIKDDREPTFLKSKKNRKMKDRIKQGFSFQFNGVMFVFTIALVLLISCSGEDNKQGNTISYTETNKPSTIFPQLTSKPGEAQISAQIHGNLVSLDPETGEPIPSIARDWMVNSDFSRFVFYLRKDVLFHEDAVFGKSKTRSVQAIDVVASIKHLVWNCKKHDIPLGFIANISGIEKFYDACSGNSLPEIPIEGIIFSDEHTLVFELYGSYPAFLYGLAALSMSIMPNEALQTYGNENNIGCGPFKISKATMKESVWTLEKNQKYVLDSTWVGSFDKMTIYFDQSTEKELQMLSEGTVNLIFNLSKEHANRFMESNIDRFEGQNAEFQIIKPIENSTSDLFTIYQSSLQGIKFDSFGIIRFHRVKQIAARN